MPLLNFYQKLPTNYKNKMKASKLFLVLLVFSFSAILFACNSTKKSNDKPLEMIEIVVSNNRVAALSAKILKEQIAKANGSSIIVEKPSGDSTYKIYLGRDFMGELGCQVPQKRGSYGIRQGNGFIVIAGKDQLFSPKEPFARNKAERNNKKQQWDQLTNAYWGNPYINIKNNYNATHDLWAFDDMGTIYGTFDLLESLGFRWFMPGTIGEVIPKQLDLNSLDKKNRCEKPDHDLRNVLIYGNRFSNISKEDLYWELSLKLNRHSGYSDRLMLGHGMRNIHNRTEQQQNKSFFALFNNKIDNYSRGFGKPCLQSQALFNEHVNFILKYYEQYKEEVISVMPTDAYAILCEHDYCQALKREGIFQESMSDYVWEYVNKLAKHIYSLNPKIKLSCFAYGTYLMPPRNITRFPDNLYIGVCGRFDQFEEKGSIHDGLIDRWSRMTDNKIIVWDYYLESHENSKNYGIPLVRAEKIKKHIKDSNLAGKSIELNLGKDKTGNLAFVHLEVYLTSKLLWDKDEDVESILKDYFSKFYGDGAKEIESLFKNQIINKNKKDLQQNFTNIQSQISNSLKDAKEGTFTNSRLKLLKNYIAPMQVAEKNSKRVNLKGAQMRVRPVRLNAKELVVDGDSKEKFWSILRAFPISKGNNSKKYKNTYKLAWSKNSLLIFISTESDLFRKEDGITVYIDALDIPVFSFSINEKGKLYNITNIEESAFRKGVNYGFQSKGKCTYEIEVDISKLGLTNLKNYRPTENYPWFFNIVRKNGSETYSIFFDENEDDIGNMIKLATKG